MTYSIDLKKRVLKFVKDGGSKVEASRRFLVSRVVVYKWLQDPDVLKPKAKQIRHRKIDREALALDVLEHPDHFLHERGRRLGVSAMAVSKMLRTLGLVKKTAPISRARRYEKDDLRRNVGEKRKTIRS
jgi:transposase